jgi:hypothetical protein
MKLVQSKQTTTFQDTADAVVGDLKHSQHSQNDEKTTRRRVYDVLNVFLASGVITREGRSIRFRPLGATTPLSDVPECERPLAESCEQKQSKLISKIKLLLAYRGLIHRNSTGLRPATAIQLPAIIVGFNSNIQGDSSASLDQKSLQIQASANPSFYSPMDVLGNIGISVEAQREALRHIPALASMEPYVFGDVDQI